MGCFSGKISVWVAALGLILALVGLLVATDESLRHIGRTSPLTAAGEPEKSAHGAPADDAYHPPGSPVWMTP